MLAEYPTVSDSLPLGDVTVTLGTGAIVNAASLTSFTAALDASLIRIDICVETEFGTVQV